MKCASFAFALGFLAIGLASKPILAATRSASFSVTATVADTCLAATQSPAPAPDFATAASPASAVSVHCVIGTPYTVNLRAAQSAGSTPSATGSNLNQPLNQRESGVEAAIPGNRGRLVGMKTLLQSNNGSEQPLTWSGLRDGLNANAAGDYPDSLVVTILY